MCHYSQLHLTCVKSSNNNICNVHDDNVLDKLEMATFQTNLLGVMALFIADPRGRQGRAPPLDPNIFHFHAIFGKMGKIVGWRSHLSSWRPLLCEIVDPPQLLLMSAGTSKGCYRIGATNNQYISGADFADESFRIKRGRPVCHLAVENVFLSRNKNAGSVQKS